MAGNKGGTPFVQNQHILRANTRATFGSPGDALLLDDNNMVVAGPGGGTPTSKTYSEIAALIDTEALTPNTYYYISDRDIWVYAVSASMLSPFAKRRMKCPFGYGYQTANVPGPSTIDRNMGVWSPLMSLKVNSPANADRWTITLDAGDFAVGEYITGGSSGKVALIQDVNTGVGVNYVRLTDRGSDYSTFTSGEAITSASGNSGTINPPEVSTTYGVIWGGYFWKNLTGELGTAVDDVTLDNTNWIRIEKDDPDNAGLYVDVYFDIVYDVGNDWVSSQADRYGNVIGVDFSIKPNYNPCDVSQWNDARIYNNIVPYGIIGNSSYSAIINNNARSIIGNRLRVDAEISDNKDSTSGINYNGVRIGINQNIGVDIVNNLVEGIWQNNGSGFQVIDNMFFGTIHENYGTVTANVNAEGTGEIAYNVCPSGIGSNACVQILNNYVGAISENLCTEIANNHCNLITGNTMAGLLIDGNRCTGSIADNTITGNIVYNVAVDISTNTNDGQIGYNLICGSITNNSGVGSVTNKISPIDIDSQVLAGNITTNPGVPAAITTANLVGKTATFGDDGQLIDFS